MTLEYRSYSIQRTHGLYIATTADGDDLELSSRHAHRLIRSVDQMWDALETGVLPEWISEMLKSGSSSIDLDLPVIAAQIPDGKRWLAEAQRLFKTKGSIGATQMQTERTASEVDPPNKFFFVPTALVTAAGLAFLMHQFITGAEPAIVFTLAVTATALVFGSIQAAILSGLSMIAYNLCIVPPVFEFTLPTVSELFYAAINFGISFVIPLLSKQPIEESSVTLETA
jgi:K+-sensing histidine kinase KdpD